MEQLLTKLIEMIQSKSPELWNIASRQIAMYNFVDAVWMIISVVIVGTLYFLLKKCKEDTYSNNEKYGNKVWYIDDEVLIFLKVFGVMAIIGFSILFVVDLVTVCMRLYNPDYYTLQALMSLVTSK